MGAWLTTPAACALVGGGAGCAFSGALVAASVAATHAMVLKSFHLNGSTKHNQKIKILWKETSHREACCIPALIAALPPGCLSGHCKRAQMCAARIDAASCISFCNIPLALIQPAPDGLKHRLSCSF